MWFVCVLYFEWLAHIKILCTSSEYIYIYKRCIRIIPLYWLWFAMEVVIKLISLFFEIRTWNLPDSVFDWVRHFLGLSFVIPSEYCAKSECCMSGVGTVSHFLVFYFIVPCINRWVHSFKSSIMFFIICLISHQYITRLVFIIFSKYGLENQWHFLYFGPLGVMIYFAYGLVIYYGLQESKAKLQQFSLLLVVLQMVLPNILFNVEIFDIEICFGLGLIIVLYIQLPVVSSRLGDFALKMQKYTFPLFLCHWASMSFVDVILRHYQWFSGWVNVIILFMTVMITTFIFEKVNEKVTRLLIRIVNVTSE